MSPVSSWKASDRGARVQVPFTLSDTCTCPGAPYSETQPTSRSPSATGRVSVTVAVETLDPVENAAPWTKVGVVDWAAAVRGSGRRAPRVAITARPAVDRTDGKSFTAVTPPLHALSSARPATAGVAGEEPGTRAHAVLQAISAPAGVSPPSRAAPHALGNVGPCSRRAHRDPHRRDRHAMAHEELRLDRAREVRRDTDARYLLACGRAPDRRRHARGVRPAPVVGRGARRATSPPAGRRRCAGTPPP